MRNPFLAQSKHLNIVFVNSRLHVSVEKLISTLQRGLSRQSFVKRDTDPSLLYPTHNLSVPIDHFHNDTKYVPHSDGMFDLRYWFDASHYTSGGPVIILAGGETDGEDRLPYLQDGILAQLAQATNGVGVVLEHRYYGNSFPTPDLSTENLRFLTTEQALADTAYFAQNIVFPGLEDDSLTAGTTPYIVYGGSYAGGFAAFLRTLYPGIFWGAISSSGVTEAVYNFWQYYEPIRQFGPPECISVIQIVTDVVDTVLLNKTGSVADLKAVFGMSNITYNDDFASVLSYPLEYWQDRNWDPAVNSPEFMDFCNKVTNTSLIYPSTSSRKSSVQSLLALAGYKNASSSLVTSMLNYIGSIDATWVTPCIKGGETLDECFSTHNQSSYTPDSLSQTWRSWPYQYCTQWGYLVGGSGVPKNQLPLVSRTITPEYNSIICRDAFNITTPPDTEAINKYGGFDIKYPRLALIGGQADPWRPATPLADSAPNRTSTTSEPVVLIEGAVHHWDENGLFPNETTATLPPSPVKKAQQEEAVFVKQWLEEWKNSHVSPR